MASKEECLQVVEDLATDENKDYQKRYIDQIMDAHPQLEMVIDRPNIEGWKEGRRIMLLNVPTGELQIAQPS